MTEPEEGIIITELGGLCPVQGHGTIDGVPFYFRSRGSGWAVEIGPGNTHLVVEAMARAGYKPSTESEAIAAAPVWTYGEDYGTWPEAGYMPHDEAWTCIERAADHYRRRESGEL